MKTRAITYLIYILLYLTLVLGGIGYAVFVLGHSYWWLLLAFVLNYTTYSPSSWMNEEDD